MMDTTGLFLSKTLFEAVHSLANSPYTIEHQAPTYLDQDSPWLLLQQRHLKLNRRVG
eukprot:CAMPEP_0117772208 /NCGR_PEP_ID=MMETSP0947-20121206/24931_1 /TAXON_ID=44440 /ORGANISM="Chattonella subsalsa, Strain CCMP2191" /LENGTH=56 /DNA_ID=CAMNT_0005597731 /DNA_START=294 /DNA_END=464 /DNA_ORIENTATION=+